MIRSLARIFVADGDISGMALFFAGLAALVGLMARVVGLWP